jgi:hypothetical protein
VCQCIEASRANGFCIGQATAGVNPTFSAGFIAGISFGLGLDLRSLMEAVDIHTAGLALRFDVVLGEGMLMLL